MGTDRHTNRGGLNRIDLTGRTFGRLLVLRDSGLRKSRRPIYVCVCDCGAEVNVLGRYLGNGDTRSCGCLAKGAAHNRDAVGQITLSFWTPIVKQARVRGIPFQIEREYAWSLYEQQARRCALSGVPIVFSTNIRDQRGTHTCSLDRVENDRAYVVGNVQWVHKRINIMKNVSTQDDFVAWCGRVQNWMVRPSIGRGLPVIHAPRADMSNNEGAL